MMLWLLILNVIMMMVIVKVRSGVKVIKSLFSKILPFFEKQIVVHTLLVIIFAMMKTIMKLVIMMD